MRMWRYAVINHLRFALKARVLNSGLSTPDVQRLLSTAYCSERHPRWIIYIDRIVSKAHFLGYVARYVRRPPICKWRILRLTDGQVEFVAKDTKRERLVRSWRATGEFVRLLASHVPE